MKKQKEKEVKNIFFDRDLSWLSFNERVLSEAQNNAVPLLERLRFLAIYSSNLDEFYRVRMPALMAVNGISDIKESKRLKALLPKINSRIKEQLKYFGSIIERAVLKDLRKEGIHLVYKEIIPHALIKSLNEYFINSVATYINIINISAGEIFFPENNKLYLLVTTRVKRVEQIYVVNIPSDVLSRFLETTYKDKQYIIFLDDIVKLNLIKLFSGKEVVACQSFKITRDAELDLKDEFSGNLAEKIEKRINVRDLGKATRFLYEPGIPAKTLALLKRKLNLDVANCIPGGTYHNLKDLSNLPLKDPKFQYEVWSSVPYKISFPSIFDEITRNDILLHFPYHKYDTVFRFFNEASIDETVEHIYVTLYRVANDSRIVSALMNAAKNGKKVTVFIELKARFDEANNIKWSKKMKAAGIQIIESIPELKVHAKLALIRKKNTKGSVLLGLLATGNFNEQTARFYTDHSLLTANQSILKEVERLFLFLKKRRKPTPNEINFRNILVGQFNLQEHFIGLIEQEIKNFKNGLPAGITIKLNNLDEEILINKLYDASRAGVKISLIVRGICRLVPGISGMSENISVIRIIDRYLEHSRIFIFRNNDKEIVLLGSADWMNRNIYRRIEVCFPVNDPKLNEQIVNVIHLQLNDNVQAVQIDEHGNNVPLKNKFGNIPIRSQNEIGKFLLNSTDK
jgi:polyphosphate kinase